jgi:phosphohistidine swiveling domain-containing protein
VHGPLEEYEVFMSTFGTKAETLLQLKGQLKYAKVLPQLSFTVRQWLKSGRSLKVLSHRPDWLSSPVIVRSSGINEDSPSESLAGHFISIPNVYGDEQLAEAIEAVVDSFGNNNLDDQVFLQPMLIDVEISGVAFTRDPGNAGHYYIINYDDSSGQTGSVTNGRSNDLKTYYHVKNHLLNISQNIKKKWLLTLLKLLEELELYFKNDGLDIEFAVNVEGTIFLLQVRPLVFNVPEKLNIHAQKKLLLEIEAQLKTLAKPHPYLLGKKSIFGIMPDWNPAEIIGVRPKPLALSLYKTLVTDSIWAYQRDNYGYRNLRSFPLLVSFAGLPYIDVRVSFNSFIPRDLEEGLAERLVNYYIDNLQGNPNHHDKIEFEIIFSCYTLDLKERLKSLGAYGFNQQEQEKIAESLCSLTNDIIHGKEGLWKKDIEKIEQLQVRQKKISKSNLNNTEKIYWLLEDCKRYGTLPFAGLARAAFIAIQLLQSLVKVGVLNEDEYDRFISSLNTVSSNMTSDYKSFNYGDFLEKYGHLRPGTYDILSPRYDEKPGNYFNWNKVENNHEVEKCDGFSIGLATLNKLEKILSEHSLKHDGLSLFDFIKGAIEGREYAKFIFTRSLSDAIKTVCELGDENGFSRDELSYMNIGVIKRLYSSSDNKKEVILSSIKSGKLMYEKTLAINFPSLIVGPEDIWSFELPKNTPNFITNNVKTGIVVNECSNKELLQNNILMMISADPGYDWIFSHNIGGFITMYGGANSHMAIRAGELNVPAVIGAGEMLYRQWSGASILEIDCANKQVLVIK